MPLPTARPADRAGFSPPRRHPGRPGAALFVAAALLVGQQTAAVRADPARTESAARLVARVGNEAVAVYAGGMPSEAEARAAFARLVGTGFDVDRIAQACLGPPWHSASPSARERYLAAFRVHLADAHARRFRRYRGERLVVRHSRPIRVDETLVTTEVARAGERPREIAWRVRHDARGPRIVDLYVDGVSLTRLKRDDFAAFLARHGGDLDALSAALEAHRFEDPD